MRQLVYISSANPALDPDPEAILAVSRRNNVARDITGLLYFDGKRFLQAIEGEDAAITELFARLTADPRHRAIVTLSDRSVAAREFGQWAMARRLPGDAYLQQIARLVANAAPSVRATFEGFAQLSRAA